MAAETTSSKKPSSSRRNVTRGIVHVKASFNNTIVTITDLNGETIAWGSAGTVGFKGSRKSTPFAASRASEDAANKAKRMGLTEVEVRVRHRVEHAITSGPRVVDHDVDLAECLDSRGCQHVGLVESNGVGRHHDRSATLGQDQGDRLGRRLGVKVVDHDRCTVMCQTQGSGATDTPTGAGDDGHPVIET